MDDLGVPTLIQDDSLVDRRDQQVLFAALDSFRQYRQAAHYNITHLRRQAFYSLSSAHTDLLCEAPFSLPSTFRKVDDAIDQNADIAEAILNVNLLAFGIQADDKTWHGAASANDLDKARSTIRQLYRDWSLDGISERQACFEPILKVLLNAFRSPSINECAALKVLVPGAGLGRLVFDICLAGYSVEGNEISFHSLMASNYMLNCTEHAQQHTLYPWALSFSNHLTRSNQFHSVAVPDVHPATTLAAVTTETHFSERMSMSAGDFCVIYKQPSNADSFDAVTTCYFIDTAPNLINYVETVKHCLRTGGVWINLGPLLWHFESSPAPAEKRTGIDDDGMEGIGEPGSFELSNDEVLALLNSFGFSVEVQRPPRSSGYIQDPKSMLQSSYNHVFWVATKL